MTSRKSRQCSVVLPEKTFREVKKIADERCVTVASMLRRFVRLGLLVEGTPGATLLIQEGDVKREVILL